MLSDGEKRALIAEAEKHVEIVRCGNPSHTNFAVGCPDCGVFCEWCDDEWPCLPRRLADALESSLTVPDGDAREAAVEVITGGTISVPGGYGNLARDDAENIVDALLAEFPILSRDIAGELEAEVEDVRDEDGEFSAGYLRAFQHAIEIVRNGR